MGGKTASKKIKNHKMSKLVKTPIKQKVIIKIHKINSLRWWKIEKVLKIQRGAIKSVNNTKNTDNPSTAIKI